VLRSGLVGWGVLDRSRENELVLSKQVYGLSPAAIRKIRASGVTRVMVCGVDTDAGVLGVMFSLFDAGVECRVKPELCWSSSGLPREAGDHRGAVPRAKAEPLTGISTGAFPMTRCWSWP
jgi:nicotinamidase-related amidase